MEEEEEEEKGHSPKVTPTKPSIRIDGSVRRERKIRPGYTPPSSVPSYVPPMLRDSPVRTTTKSLCYKLIDGQYEIVEYDNSTSIWSAE
jgi:hypothetical protein